MVHTSTVKKLHIIHTQSLAQIEPAQRAKILPTLEEATLEWAEAVNKPAYSATIQLKKQLDSGDPVHARYFKFLRRLLDLKLQDLETKRDKDPDRPAINVDEELKKLLKIESIRLPTYLSCTRIGMYDFCPRKYYWRYCLGVKTPKTTALHFGSAVDEALNFYFEEKIKGSAPPMEAVYSSFFENFENGYDEVNWGDDDPVALKKRGPLIIDTYVKNFDDITEATDVQTEITVQLDNGGYLTGFIDILEADAVVDTKTAKKFWNDKGMYAKHKQELQPKAYSLWFLQEFERMPKEFRYQIVTKDPEPKTQLIRFELKKFELEAFRRKIQRIWDEICEKTQIGKTAFAAQAEPGSKPGRGPGSEKIGVLCTKQWCNYHDLCTKDGLKIPSKWVSKTKDTPGHHVYEE
jgi:hypothetical protein